MTPQVTDWPQRLLQLLPSSPSTTVLYLLFPALIVGIVESQTGNMTEGESSQPEGKLEGRLGNHTFSVSRKDDSTVKPGNVTSILHQDELSKLEGELGLPSNQTFNVTTEDDEHFQDQEFYHPHMQCHEDVLMEHSHSYCGAEFHENMLTISEEHWCDLDYIIRPYNDMTTCMETLSVLVGCYYPNPNVQDFFLHIHAQYFKNCSEEELLLSDAPHGVVVILTLIPVSLIPVLVFLVVWKSKVRE